MDKTVKTNIQVTLQDDIKEKANYLAKADGFENLPSLARFLITQYVYGELSPTVKSPSPTLKELKKNLDSKYEEFKKEHKKGNTLQARSGKEFVKHLKAN